MCPNNKEKRKEQTAQQRAHDAQQTAIEMDIYLERTRTEVARAIGFLQTAEFEDAMESLLKSLGALSALDVIVSKEM
jgi:hypothetical protein